jgi:hypothetical protein
MLLGFSNTIFASFFSSSPNRDISSMTRLRSLYYSTRERERGQADKMCNVVLNDRGNAFPLASLFVLVEKAETCLSYSIEKCWFPLSCVFHLGKEKKNWLAPFHS